MSNEIVVALATEKNELAKQLQRRDLYIDYLLSRLSNRKVIGYDYWIKMEIKAGRIAE